ncbi:DUF2807 domain-containing protein [bacterium AH-315-B15]|nr:DUF2807 domain-containing protein [bacterium AH-315-B15]
MKNFSVIATLGALALLFFIVTGYGSGWIFDCEKGKEAVKKEVRKVDAFQSISLAFSGTVEVTQSNTTSVEVEANADLLPFIETTVKDGKLSIGTKKGKCISSNDPIIVRVSTPNVSGLSVNGSGEIITKGKISTKDLSVSINGSGDIIVDKLSVENYSVSINGSGDVELSGTQAKTGDISIHGSGDVNTSNVPTSAIAVSVSGSGDVIVKPTAAMDVSIMGSGDVTYYGSPKISKSIMGSGDLIQH